MIEVISPGPYATVQDRGRIGYAAWGYAPGGAADRTSYSLANRVVGNEEGAAALELLLGGATLRFHRPAVVAVTGATGRFTVDGAPGRCNGPQQVPAGSLVKFDTPSNRLWIYLAVRGGIATDVVLGSRATAEASGLGRALRAGDLLPIGSGIAGPPRVDVVPLAGWPADPIPLHGVFGPRDDYLSAASLAQLEREPYVVDATSDRIGIRLNGPRLERSLRSELLSEPTIRGAVEVPPDGQPIVFSADHPTTCGYPVVAVLDPDSANLITQIRPGHSVRFCLTRLRPRRTAPRTSRPLGTDQKGRS